MLAAVNPINDLIDELSPDGGIYVAYTTNGCSESVSLELDTLYCDQVDSLYDEDDQPIDPKVFLAQKMVDLISKLEQVKTALLKKYPPQGPAGVGRLERVDLGLEEPVVVPIGGGGLVARQAEDFDLEDIAAADAAASQVAGGILQAAGLVERGVPS